MASAASIRTRARRLERHLRRVEDTARTTVARAVEVGALDSALALTSRLFVAVIPAALVVTALLPSGDSFADRLVSGLQLRGAGREAAEALFATPGTIRAGMSVATCLVVVYSLVSCGGVLQRSYRAAWRLRDDAPGSWRGDLGRRMLWAISLVAYVAVSWLLAGASPSGDLTAAGRDAGRIALAVSFYAWTPYVLLDRRVPAQRLLPTALLGALAFGVLAAVAPLYVPHLASASARSYGIAGFAFSLMAWLFVQALLIVAAAVAGAVIAQRGDATELQLGDHPARISTGAP